MSAIKFIAKERMTPIELNTNFDNLIELMALTNVLSNGLEILGFTNIKEDINKSFTMEYMHKHQFNIEEPVTGYGFFMPIDAIKVIYPINKLKLTKLKLIADLIDDDNALECIELIDTIIEGIDKTNVFYFEVSK
jgi:hypothetical protein